MDGSMSGQAIYDNFAQGSLAGLVDGADKTARICTNYDARVIDLKNVQVNSYAAWLGAASESARLAGEPVITTQEVALPHIFSAALSMVQQAEAFESAKNAVVPIPPMPEKPGFWDNVLDPYESNLRFERQLLAVNAANDHNIAVMAAYEEATRQNQVMLTRIPGTPDPPAPTPPIHPIGPPADPQPWVPGPGERPPSGVNAPPGGQQTEPSITQPATRLPASPPNPADLTHANLAQPMPTRIELDVAPPKPTQPAPGGASTPVGTIGAPRGFGPDGRVSDGARPGRGSGSGPHGTPPPAAPSGRTPATGTPGRGGPGGQPPTGAGARARGEEDLERERPSFLVEPDPEETFGTNEVTAPPVIGA